MTSASHKSSRPLILIVPSLPPTIDGIGDYSLQLARRLRMYCGVEVSFIVCDPLWQYGRWDAEFVAVRLEERSRQQLLTAVASLTRLDERFLTPILLQFSPYGYQQRGAPVWLLSALEALEKMQPGRINVAFHELDVKSSNLLSSAYWVAPLQQQLIQRLLRIARFTYTNTQQHRAKLQFWGAHDVSLIPNFANIGELESAPPMSNRARQVVIFGRADQRRWTYTRGAGDLRSLCAHLEATQIVDIGAPIPEQTLDQIGGTPIVRLGILPGEAVAATMRSSLASFMYYPISLLTKSGVHATCCASGTIPFISTEEPLGTLCEGLVHGLDYIVVKESYALPPIDDLERLAPVIFESYCKRTSAVAAITIAQAFLQQRIVADKSTLQTAPAGSCPMPPAKAALRGSRTENHEVVL